MDQNQETKRQLNDFDQGTASKPDRKNRALFSKTVFLIGGLVFIGALIFVFVSYQKNKTFPKTQNQNTIVSNQIASSTGSKNLNGSSSNFQTYKDPDFSPAFPSDLPFINSSTGVSQNYSTLMNTNPPIETSGKNFIVKGTVADNATIYQSYLNSHGWKVQNLRVGDLVILTGKEKNDLITINVGTNIKSADATGTPVNIQLISPTK
jgi:hypothetical protein